jgi:probable F420-dependent oxidoreductase
LYIVAVRFSVLLPRPQPDLTPEALVNIACAIERAGLDACSLTDHPFPVIDETQTGHHALDPFAALAYIAAATERLRLHTNIVVLPYRNPFIVAKAAATLDYLSSGRLILGVAAGYLEQEFSALGVAFAQRDQLTDDGVSAIQLAWTGEPVYTSAGDWVAEGNSMQPVPTAIPHPPIWTGGNGTRALKRAVQTCQGWSPYEVPWPRSRDTRTVTIGNFDDLRGRIRVLHELIEEHERTDTLDICYVRGRTEWLTGSDDSILDEVGALEEMGVTWVACRLDAEIPEGFIERVFALGELSRDADS